MNPKYAPYARETAMCVDFAYDTFEGDIRAELERANGEAAATLKRLLLRVRERRAVLDQFTRVTSKAA